MKAILKPVSPELCEKVIYGECTLLLSKTRPKTETPFKEYIYCTKGSREALWHWKGEWYYDIQFPEERPNRANGKVIGEFVCDRIIVDERGENAYIFSKYALLSLDEQKEYCANKTLYGLHISELKIYDKPKELREFRGFCSKKAKCYSDIIRHCNDTHLTWKCNPLTRAPQSWCYVEELEEL